jgi:hypothetical protein
LIALGAASPPHAARFAGPAQPIRLHEPAYVVADTEALGKVAARRSYTEAEDTRRSSPGADSLQIVGAHEVEPPA